MLIGIADVIPDPVLTNQLQEKCWVDHRWSASINPKGCFFCEIAAAMDLLFDGPGGHPIEKGWWQKDPSSFRDQQNRYCCRCGACVPFLPVTLSQNMDVVSRQNFEQLKSIGSPKFLKNQVRLLTGKLTADQIAEYSEDWDPWDHRGKVERREPASPGSAYGAGFEAVLQVSRFFRSKSALYGRTEVAVKRSIWQIQTKTSRLLCGLRTKNPFYRGSLDLRDIARKTSIT